MIDVAGINAQTLSLMLGQTPHEPSRRQSLLSLCRQAEAALSKVEGNPPPLVRLPFPPREASFERNLHSFQNLSRESLDFVYRVAWSRVLLSSLLQR